MDWGILNMSLKTGDAKDRKNLWTRKSRVSVPWVLRSITSPSGQLNISPELMVEVRKVWRGVPAGTGAEVPEISVLQPNRWRHYRGELDSSPRDHHKVFNWPDGDVIV